MITPTAQLLDDAQDLDLERTDLPCVRNADVDWHSDHARERRLAAYLCVTESCPLLEACNAYAERARERFGVWGGIDRETAYREKYDTNRHGRTPQPCGTAAAYRRHARRGETPCGPCRAARAEDRRRSA